MNKDYLNPTEQEEKIKFLLDKLETLKNDHEKLKKDLEILFIRTKKEYKKEYLKLMKSLCNKVYKINYEEKLKVIEEEAEIAFSETKKSPLEYIIFQNNPNLITNQKLKGQKKLIKRWNNWIEKRK